MRRMIDVDELLDELRWLYDTVNMYNKRGVAEIIELVKRMEIIEVNDDEQ